MAAETSYVAWASQLVHRSQAAAASLLERLKPVERQYRIFDFGFGDGELILALVQLLDSCEVHGADTVPDLVHNLARRLPHARLLIGDGNEALNATSAKYDLVLISHLLYYFGRDQWLAVISDAAEHLAPGGRIAIALVSVQSAAYQDPVRPIMAAAGCATDARSADGGRYYAEDLLALLPPCEEWELEWRVDLAPLDMAAFLCFLYRFGEGLPQLRELSSRLPQSLPMIDRWILLSKEQALSLA